MLADASDLLERGVERRRLLDAVEDAAAGRAATMIVEGPAGVGKSRLLREARALAVTRGVSVLTARGLAGEEAFSFGVVRQLFEPVLGSLRPEERAAWLSGAAAPAEAALHSTPGPSPEDFAVLRGLYQLTANLTRDDPVLLILDDMQWMDAPSLRFIAYLLLRVDATPVVMIGAVRSGETSAVTELLNEILAAPGCRWLRPEPLSAAAVQVVLDTAFPGERVDPAFARACHEATRGNPLLLSQLTALWRAEGLAPTANLAGQVLAIGPRAVARHVALTFARMSGQAKRLAQAAALLGDDVSLPNASALAGLDEASGLAAVTELEDRGILLGRPLLAPPRDIRLSYVHPLVRAAVYQGLPASQRRAEHARAVDILADEDPERVAAHLLVLEPSGIARHVGVLRDAMTAALARGAPETAYTYLRRCLAEDLPSDDRLKLLMEAGRLAAMSDTTTSAIDHFYEALRSTADPVTRAEISLPLGELLSFANRFEESRVVQEEALRALPPGNETQTLLLKADRLALSALQAGGWRQLPDLDEMRERLRRGGPGRRGSRELAAFLAGAYSYQGNPAAAPLARRALAGGELLRTSPGSLAVVVSWWCLAFADDEAALDSIEASVNQARRLGASRELVGALTYRLLVRSRRGDLDATITDGVECMEAIDNTRMEIARSYLGPWFAEALIEMGDLSQAQRVLDWVRAPSPLPDAGAWHMYPLAQSRLHRARGEHDQALSAALQAGECFESLGGRNPAINPWRSEAALCLHAQGRTREGHELAREEIELAEKSRSLRAHGVALRVAGLTAERRDQFHYLERAVAVLEDSTARLEHARALVDLGSGLRRSGRRAQAVERLRQGIDLAERCGARLLVQRGLEEVRSAGARPRRTMSTGPEALTASERRVALLAAAGRTNRDIAQQLFISVKTVEVHLSSVYRKLGIRRRRQLPAELPNPTSVPTTT